MERRGRERERERDGLRSLEIIEVSEGKPFPSQQLARGRRLLFYTACPVNSAILVTCVIRFSAIGII